MKLTKEQKKSLGIEFDGEDVPDDQVNAAIEALSQKAARVDGLPDDVEDLRKDAAAGATLVAEKRTEVTRLAKLAELGAEEGDLDEVVVDQINDADADGLIKLEKYFTKRAADKLKRSSAEDGAQVETAGGVQPTGKALPKVLVH